MVEELVRVLEQARYAPLERLECQHLRGVHASPEQLFGIACYEAESDLIAAWKLATDELASKVQSRLSGGLSDLRWDMYLLLVVDGPVSDLTRKLIENDRLYFRKLVLACDDWHEEAPHLRRLPFVHIQPTQELALFQEAEFLEQLKGRLSPAAAERLGAGFFAGGTLDAAALFGLTRGGGGDEDSSD